MHSERSQTQKGTQCVFPVLWTVQNRQIHRDRKQICGCQGRGGGQWRVTAKQAFRVSVGEGNALELMVVMTAALCECAGNADLQPTHEWISWRENYIPYSRVITSLHRTISRAPSTRPHGRAPLPPNWHHLPLFLYNHGKNRHNTKLNHFKCTLQWR